MLFEAAEKAFRDDERASFAASKSLFCNALCASWLRGCFSSFLCMCLLCH